MRVYIAFTLIMVLAGCAGNKPMEDITPKSSNAYSGENLYTKSYFGLDRPNVALNPDSDGPKLFRGNNKDTDNNRMLVKGFDMLGYSNFESGDVPPEQALEQAKNLKADLVLLYTNETTKTPASVRVQQMREQAAKDKSGKASEDSAVNKSPNFSYYASYWVKLAPPVIGVHVRNVGKNAPVQGLDVLAAVEDSPAFRAGLQEGDLLKKIGDIELVNTDSLAQVVQQYAGKTVDVSYEREGVAKTTSMTLNSRK